MTLIVQSVAANVWKVALRLQRRQNRDDADRAPVAGVHISSTCVVEHPHAATHLSTPRDIISAAMLQACVFVCVRVSAFSDL